MDHDLKQCLDAQFQHGMPLPLIQSCMLQLFSGLAFCHSRLVLHRDLKPQNVLIDRNGRVKLADFGLARAFQARKLYTQEVVTLWYRAPELLLGNPEYTAAVDVWSTGCILAELFCRQPLFSGDSEIDQIFRIFRLRGTPTEATWPGVTKLPNYQENFPKWHAKAIDVQVPQIVPSAVDLASQLITYAPTQRLTAQDAMGHPFFDDARGAEFVVPLDTYLAPDSVVGLASPANNSAELDISESDGAADDLADDTAGGAADGVA